MTDSKFRSRLFIGLRIFVSFLLPVLLVGTTVLANITVVEVTPPHTRKQMRDNGSAPKARTGLSLGGTQTSRG